MIARRWPSSRATATGRQSAVSRTSGWARREVTNPSDLGNGSLPGSVNRPEEGVSPTSRTSAPCTCQAIVARAGSPPSPVTARRRFSATEAG